MIGVQIPCKMVIDIKSSGICSTCFAPIVYDFETLRTTNANTYLQRFEFKFNKYKFRLIHINRSGQWTDSLATSALGDSYGPPTETHEPCNKIN